MASNPGNEESVTSTQESAWVAELRGKLSTVLANQATILQELQGLRAYVEKIEAEAHASMEKFSSPEAMAEMAGKFLGGGF